MRRCPDFAVAWTLEPAARREPRREAQVHRRGYGSPRSARPAGRRTRDGSRGTCHKRPMIDHPTRDAGFGVYVHWPFCASKCPYCDFNSHVRHQPVDQERFLAAFRREIAHIAARIPGRTVTSIFFGGGTPSLMKPGTVGADPRCRRRRLGGRCRTPRSRSRPIRPASRRSASAAIARPASTASRSACRRSTIPICAGSAACIRSTRRSPRSKIAASIFERYLLRPHLRAAGPDAGSLGATSWSAAIDHAVEHLSLYQLTIEPGTLVRTAARRRQAHRAGRRCRPRALRPHAGDLRGAGPAGLRDLQSRTAGRRIAPQPASIGATANMPASVRARMAVWSPAMRAASPPSTEKHPETWLERVERDGPRHHRRGRADARRRKATSSCSWACACKEGHRSGRYATFTGRSLDERRVQDLAERGPDRPPPRPPPRGHARGLSGARRGGRGPGGLNASPAQVGPARLARLMRNSGTPASPIEGEVATSLARGSSGPDSPSRRRCRAPRARRARARWCRRGGSGRRRRRRRSRIDW